MVFLSKVTASGEVRIGSSNKAEIASLCKVRGFASTAKRGLGVWGLEVLDVI